MKCDQCNRTYRHKHRAVSKKRVTRVAPIPPRIACPTCTLGAYVTRTELGYKCTFCGADWPYGDE